VELILFALPVLLLVLMFTSQRKRQRTVEQLQASLQPGQQIVTTSGLFARVVELDEAVAVLETGPGQRVRWDRRAIGGVVAEGARGYLPQADYGVAPMAEDPADDLANPTADPASTAPGEPGHPARPGDQNPRS
jgi:preprotein translocase subunit YajC